MADNITYLSLKKRLTIIKLLAEANDGLNPEEKRERIAKVNLLLKLLDIRYDEGKFLDPVEDEILSLEHIK